MWKICLFTANVNKNIGKRAKTKDWDICPVFGSCKGQENMHETVCMCAFSHEEQMHLKLIWLRRNIKTIKTNENHTWINSAMPRNLGNAYCYRI